MTIHQHSHRITWVLWGFLLIIGSLLFTEHRLHVLGFLPYLFLLACPLMHMFHHGHGGSHHHHNDQSPPGQKSQGPVKEESK